MDSHEKAYSPACERNKDYILEILKEILPETGTVLEIGSGSGQHITYFAHYFPQLLFQPTDRAVCLSSIEAWRYEADSQNVNPALELDLLKSPWPVSSVNAAICINTIHIVRWLAVENLFAGVAGILEPGGLFYAYGPYRYRNKPLEPSNENFDLWLKERDSESGIREFESVNELAQTHGLQLVEDRAMPANNRSIWWRKI